MGYSWDTAGDIVNDAAVEIGLAEAADPFTSTDSNFIQLCRLLKSLGRSLVGEKKWSYLRKEHTFTTVASTSTYDLPSDFDEMVDQTWWNRTNQLPLGGPVSDQEWQYLKARQTGIVFNVLFRPIYNKIELYPNVNTPGSISIAFQYQSSWWVSNDVTPLVTSRDYPLYSTDTIWFESNVVVSGLKLAFLKAKGFDTTAAQQDFEAALGRAKDADTPASIVSLNGPYLGRFDPPIGSQSIPITGYGS